MQLTKIRAGINPLCESTLMLLHDRGYRNCSTDPPPDLGVNDIQREKKGRIITDGNQKVWLELGCNLHTRIPYEKVNIIVACVKMFGHGASAERTFTFTSSRVELVPPSGCCGDARRPGRGQQRR
jgi:hypothetical protein